MSTTWWMYLGVGAFVFLFGLFGAYKSSQGKRRDPRLDILTALKDGDSLLSR